MIGDGAPRFCPIYRQGSMVVRSKNSTRPRRAGTTTTSIGLVSAMVTMQARSRLADFHAYDHPVLGR